MNTSSSILLAIFSFYSVACNSNSGNVKPHDSSYPASTVTMAAIDSISTGQNKNIVKDTSAADLIRKSLVNNILKNDIAFIPSAERKFQYDTYDLNNDNKLEYLVTCRSSYFCGSGGCNIYLLGHDGKLIKQFSVTGFPVFVLPGTTNGWHDLMMKSGGKFHYLKANDNKYPSNPSLQPVYNVSAPESSAQLLALDDTPYLLFSF